MNKFIFSLLLISFVFPCLAQNIGMGTVNPDPSAQVEISSNSRGLLIPRMDSIAIRNIAAPAKGLMVYDTARNQLLVNMGTPAKPQWRNLIEGSGWSLSGNQVDGPNKQYLGTANDQPLVFRVNGLSAGAVSNNRTGAVSLGFGTPPIDTTLYDKAPSGWTAVGYKALASLIGLNQFGVNVGNTAFGYEALTANTVGAGNIGVGHQALYSNISGNSNVAIGAFTLYKNQVGISNIAIGETTLYNNVGQYNTAVGFNAAVENTTGIGNTSFGYGAMYRNVAGQFNTAIGYRAALTYDLGFNNTFVGANTDVIQSGLFNVIAIGEAVTCTANSQVRIGNTATNSIGGYANWTNFSDGRFKKNMKEDVKGIDFIMKLRPITYTLDVDGIEARLQPNKQKTVHPAMLQAKAEKATTVFSGFVAQDVETAARETGYDFSGVDKPKNDKDFYGLRYADFVAPMVKAIQEQQRLIEKQQQLIDELSKKVDAIGRK